MSSIKLDLDGCFLPTYGITRDALAALGPRLDEIRSEVLNVDLPLFHSGEEVPTVKQPLDAGFTDLPDRLLAEYRAKGDASELGQILATAKRLAAEVDRVVVLGIGGSYMGARALLESCRPPYFNELSRPARGGMPQVYFEGNNVDNDATAGLLKLLSEPGADGSVPPWGIVVISKSGGTLETAVSLRIFLRALRESLGSDSIANRLVPITGKSGKLFDLSTALGCDTKFEVPDGVGGRFSILSAVGLLPAALMGLDIVRLLEGAAAMNEQFKHAAVADNPVLNYVGACHLLEQWRGIETRVMSVWSKGLEAAGLWYDQLLAESLGKDERGALPLTVVNTRDLHSRAQQHQEGRRDKVFVNVIVDQTSQADLSVGTIGANQDGLDELADKTLSQVMAAAIAGTNQAYREDQRPTMDFRLPELNEFTMGQFFQMLMLATVVEGRLLDINPYGQPGVESYKKNMNRHLRGG
ncbi:MAG: glucose-6-phosphate isomerase [Planctomycetales bacterium]|nr:glucose-6-phosphate isomerase [Planctomycetales bacterium]